ncbi:hypothetical protein N643_00335 [Salmonella bongori serovar 48:z41:-- str. RKS3044]|nr:hypothetical protein N643_00335 [Salmonella bongori serovar 48:z41:-- str. RKS3044]
MGLLWRLIVNAEPFDIICSRSFTRPFRNNPRGDSGKTKRPMKIIKQGIPAILHSVDTLEGPQAFAEKRKPVWKDR